MDERKSDRTPETPRYVATSTRLTEQEYLDSIANPKQAQNPMPSPPAQAFRVPQERKPYVDAPTHGGRYETTNKPEAKRGSKKLGRRTKVVGAFALSAVVVAGAGTGAYLTNTFDFKDWVSTMASSNAQAAAVGFETSELGYIGTQSLNADECKRPDHVILNGVIDVTLPVVPEVVTAENPTPSRIDPYLKKEFGTSMTGDAKNQFTDLITDDGYAHATLEGEPFGVTACSVGEDGATTNQGGDNGPITIYRKKIEIQIQPIDALFTDIVVEPVLQVDGIDKLKLDPKKHQYLSLPYSDSLYLTTAPSGDVKYDEARAAMTAAMATDEQKNKIRAIMETDAKDEMKLAVEGSKNVIFPESDITSFRQAVDIALMKQLTGRDSTVKDTFVGEDYVYTIKLPSDPTTKSPITDSPLIGLDNTQRSTVNNVTINFGRLKPPASTKPDTTTAQSNK